MPESSSATPAQLTQSGRAIEGAMKRAPSPWKTPAISGGVSSYVVVSEQYSTEAAPAPLYATTQAETVPGGDPRRLASPVSPA